MVGVVVEELKLFSWQLLAVQLHGLSLDREVESLEKYPQSQIKRPFTSSRS
jgi:hypothetical protein